MSNIEPSNNSSVPLSSRKANFSWNVFKNSFLLPIFSIGLLAGSGYLFYTGEPEAGAALSGSAVAAFSINNKDDKEDKESINRKQSFKIYELEENHAHLETVNNELKEQLFNYKQTAAFNEQQVLFLEHNFQLQKKLLEEQSKNVVLEQNILHLQKDFRLQEQQSLQLPPSENQPFTPKREEKLTEPQKPPDNSNIK